MTFTLANLGDEVYESRVASIGKTVEEDARTVKVIVDFPNTSQDILPGMFASAEIHTDEKEVDALPEESVLGEGTEDAHIFYTRSSESDSLVTFQRLHVSTGFSEDGLIQVVLTEPLPSEARIVISGTYFIKSEELKQRE